MSVDFCTYCYEGDIHKLRKNYIDIVDSHRYNFDKVIIIQQNCMGMNLPGVPGVKLVSSEEHPNILTEFGVPEEDPVADEISHGPNAAHYWKKHLTNHLTGLKVSTADYIVFCDSDCFILRQPENLNWIDEAINHLVKHKDCLVVSPSDGTAGPTDIMSQQLFICNRKRLKEIDWNCWDGNYIDGGPMQEYYVMAEGRIGMYMKYNNLYRQILDPSFRYWHSIEEHPIPKELL